MKSIRFILIILFLLPVCGSVQAQFGKKLGDAVKKSAENTTIRKAEQKTDEAVSKSIDKVTDPDTYKDDDKDNNSADKEEPKAAATQGTTSAPSAPASKAIQAETNKASEITYAKSDFVAGDEIFFEDDQSIEQMGEFPSQWDLLKGNAEIVSIGDKKAIYMIDNGTSITPLIKPSQSYLPDKFTLEFDYYVRAKNLKTGHSHGLFFHFSSKGKTDKVFYGATLPFDDNNNLRYEWRTPDGEQRSGLVNTLQLQGEAWHHVSISFNQRAFKMYVDGVRIVNIPSMQQPDWFWIDQETRGEGKENMYIRNVRFAKGAVPLYDRMMSDGKFITYGITFDVGKSTIKPESMGEINRIVTLMTENPTLKFSVEGHTDATGNAASNQTLSESRSKAIVDKLVESGVAADRLTASGKGQNSPIADNGTDEGRAKNRRVEFVKK